MNSLVEKISKGYRWNPQSTDRYRNSIKIEGTYKDVGHLRSNFAYSMQYIEYLQNQIEELDLHNVIQKMCSKTYIVYAMSIVEMLFTHRIKITGNWPTDSWEVKKNFKAIPKRLDKEKVLVETIIYTETDVFEKRMDFDSMIKKVESKKLIQIDHDLFPLLKHLRKLRNRIHIQIGDFSTDHDFNNFSLDDYLKTRKVLRKILLTDEFCNRKETFKFLCLED